MSGMTVTALATRSDDWWAVEVSEIPGLFTQVRRLDQVEAMVKDAAATLGKKVDAVRVEPQFSAEEIAELERLESVRRKANAAQAEASNITRQTVSMLRNRGLTVRDVAHMVGLTPQRVSMLLHR